ncbi:unnamed protein product, partial [marine sediment metagenome]
IMSKKEESWELYFDVNDKKGYRGFYLQEYYSGKQIKIPKKYNNQIEEFETRRINAGDNLFTVSRIEEELKEIIKEVVKNRRTMKKIVKAEGWMIKDDFDLFEKYLKNDGVAHADIFKNNPSFYDYPIETIRVEVIIKKVKE